ncbi:hypothetical protein L7F22_007918 [Adiantum nelumboides]|nr:hypothetical protein [Adiantum nelumboides]
MSHPFSAPTALENRKVMNWAESALSLTAPLYGSLSLSAEPHQPCTEAYLVGYCLAPNLSHGPRVSLAVTAYMIFVKDSLDVFIDDIPGELPPKQGDDDHVIELIPGSSPPNKPSYRVSRAQQEEIMRQVNELVEKGMTRQLLTKYPGVVVYGTARNPDASEGLQALKRRHPIRCELATMDVTKEETVEALAKEIHEKYGRLDLIVNCAGILHIPNEIKPETIVEQLEPEAMMRVFEVNALGPVIVAKHFWELLKIGRGTKTGRAGAVIAHISTRASSMKENTLAAWYGYRGSKTALNMSFASGNFTESSKIRKAATFLKTNALQWWTTLLNQGVVPSTWVQFKQIFAPAWITNTFEIDVMTAWNQLSAINCESLEEYNAKFWDALLPVSSFKMVPLPEQIEKYCCGFPKVIKKYCTKTSVMNMAQLMENVEVADDLIQGKPDEDGFKTRRKEPQGIQFSAKGNVTSRLTVPPFKKSLLLETSFFKTETRIQEAFTGKTTEERKALRDAKKCYICEEGHFANECPQRNSQNKDDKSDRKGKKPKPSARLVPDLVGDQQNVDATDFGIKEPQAKQPQRDAQVGDSHMHEKQKNSRHAQIDQPDSPQFSFMKDLENLVPEEDMNLEPEREEVKNGEVQSKRRIPVDDKPKSIHKKKHQKKKTFKAGDKDVKFEAYNGRRNNDKALAFIRQFEV